MLLVDEFLQLNTSEGFKEVFFVLIQLGTILAVILKTESTPKGVLFVLPFHIEIKPMIAAYSQVVSRNFRKKVCRLW